MKARFNTFDIICGVTELQKLIGLRVNQIYDIDNKTYLIRFQQGEIKVVLLLESGNRFHPTAFEWPKNVAPSGFSMKLRKHLKNKRLENVEQLGIDRIVDFQFGTGEAAYHVILELYDRGNILLTDHELTILNILRPHTEGEEVRFAVREKYPTDRAKSRVNIDEEYVQNILKSAKPGDNLRMTLVPYLECGPSVIAHILLTYGLDDCVIPGETQNKEEDENSTKSKKNKKQKKKDGLNKNSRFFDLNKDFETLMNAVMLSNKMVAEAKKAPSKGYMIQKKEIKPTEHGEEEYFYHNLEYHPFKFIQYEDQNVKEYESFMSCVDEFYSTLEGQKIDLKTVQQEREALKKLSNVKKDHAKRLEDLTKVQEQDKQKAELITRNQALVDNAILAVRSAIANQMSWPDIHELVKAAQLNGDPVAISIKQLKLEVNHIALTLSDPFKDTTNCNDDNSDEDNILEEDEFLPTLVIDVDLALSAWANARKYYDQKRTAAKKEQKTIDASEKALKSAERKTQQTLKEVRTISSISKARKVYWFEKFYWFVSSENYLVIGGRDAQQNELIVKRYMRPTDIYVHAEIQGASSVIIRNPIGGEVPPKTLLEAGTMAISYSVAWDAKVVTNAYWVKSEQVSKTAPSGEYLGTGSFMIRGKKNFLPPCHLVMGLSLLFKLEESSIERHKGERKVRQIDDDDVEKIKELTIENERLESVSEEQEVNLLDSDNENDVNDSTNPEISNVDNTKEENNEKGEKVETSNDENSDNRETSDEEVSEFPDTHIKVEHDTGKITVQVSSKEDKDDFGANSEITKEDNDDVYFIPALPTRTKQQQNSKKKKAEKEKKAEAYRNRNEEKINQSQVKRGQKGKLKKMKTKYKDQDDEERELRMAILKSARKDKNKDVKKVDEENFDDKGRPKKQFQQKQQIQDPEDIDDIPANADVDMLDSLTGVPVDEDELLFAIPVVAPYQSMQHYKFKIKLTPGPGKRGKAAKTALLMFSKDKTCSLREKDLLKSIKEESLARNIPGKVKMSAPQLQKFRK